MTAGGRHTPYLFLLALLLVACGTPAPPRPTQAPPTAGFSLEYIREYAWMNERVFISVSTDGHYDYRKEDFQTGKRIEGASGDLAASELESLAIAVVLENRFFKLGEDLSNRRCMDGADEFILVKAGGRSHRAGGYCVDDRPFRTIVDRLYAYRLDLTE